MRQCTLTQSNHLKTDLIYFFYTFLFAMRLLSRGKVQPCTIEVTAKGFTAKDFITWFEHTNEIANEPELLAAHPEHYIINNTPNGRQEVYETNGGSPFAAHFVSKFILKLLRL